MDSAPTTSLKNKALNSWNLFFLITLPICLAIIVALTQVDRSSPLGISSMIQLSVRLSVPWLYLAFAASSIHTLIPSEASRWLLRNRRILGLCFAAGMAWQLTFILWMMTSFWNYYAKDVYLLTDILVQVPGYVFLIAMTLTSFMPVRRKLSGKQWRALHKGGIYFLWATVWSTYWYELYYYDDIQAIDYVFYWAGFLAWGTRISAWIQRRWEPATT